MKISFPALVPQTREVEINQEDLDTLMLLMEQTLMFYVEYHDFKVNYQAAPYEDTARKMCEKHDVDINLRKDRVAYFEALTAAYRSKYGK